MQTLKKSNLTSQIKLFTTSTKPRSLKTTFHVPSQLQAMDDEIYALHDNGQGPLFPIPLILMFCSKWVNRTEYKKDGSIDRLKTHLVSRGYTYIEREDFDETFSLLIRHTTIPVIISIVVTKHWIIHQLVVKNALLRGTLKEMSTWSSHSILFSQLIHTMFAY